MYLSAEPHCNSFNCRSRRSKDLTKYFSKLSTVVEHMDRDLKFKSSNPIPKQKGFPCNSFSQPRRQAGGQAELHFLGAGPSSGLRRTQPHPDDGHFGLEVDDRRCLRRPNDVSVSRSGPCHVLRLPRTLGQEDRK